MIRQMVRNARAFRDDHVDRQLTQLRRVARGIESGTSPVLVFGESSFMQVSPIDSDRRKLAVMMQDQLGCSVAAVTGAGYGPRLYTEYLRVLGALRARPRVVVVAACVRTSIALHVTEHPRYGYAASLAAMRSIDHPREARPWGAVIKPTAADRERFHSLMLPTIWGEAQTIGAWRAELAGALSHLDDPHTVERVYSYFHGEPLSENNPRLGDWRAFREEIRAYGVPVVWYWTPVPLDYGERVYPGEFRSQMVRGRSLVREAFSPTDDAQITYVDMPNIPDDSFIEPRDGTEHLNVAGRQTLVRALDAPLRAYL